MKLFIFVLAGLLLTAPAAGAADSCVCAGRALCIKGDWEGGGVAAALNRLGGGRSSLALIHLARLRDGRGACRCGVAAWVEGEGAAASLNLK